MHVRDESIANLVGDKTYQRLWHTFPTLYTPFNNCTPEEWDATMVSGVNSVATDLLDFCLDTDYTPEDLKLDLQRLCRNLPPHNPEVLRLVAPTRRGICYRFTLANCIGIVILTVVLWVIIVVSCTLMIDYFINGHTAPLDLFRCF
jgi:hypothetical protein